MSLRKKTLTGLFWAVTQQVSGQFVGFIVSMVLARLLSPDDFGLMAMIYIFISLSATLADTGMSQSLIRMANPQTKDYSTAFIVNALFSVSIYVILFLTAPLIAGFYGKSILTGIIRVYGLVFVLTALGSVQHTMLIRELRFKKQLILTLPSVLLSGALGITLAAMGYGVWSLVWSGVAKAGLYSIQLWLYSKWRPGPIFDRRYFVFHFRFGIKLTMSEILNNLSSSIYPFVLGKFFSPAQAGYFTQSAKIKQFPASTLLSPIMKVAYPVLSALQSDTAKLRDAYAKMERITLTALIPAMVFGIVLAEPLLRLLFSERWVVATPYLQITCLAGIINFAGMYNSLILKIQNKSGLILWFNASHKFFILLLLAAVIPLGINAVLWSQVIGALAYYIPNSILACRSIGYRFERMVADYLLLLAIGAAMTAGVWGIRFATAGSGDLVQFAACIPGGMILYAGLIAAFNRRILNDIREIFAGRFVGWGWGWSWGWKWESDAIGNSGVSEENI